jgi:hypothetical protein
MNCQQWKNNFSVASRSGRRARTGLAHCTEPNREISSERHRILVRPQVELAACTSREADYYSGTN